MITEKSDLIVEGIVESKESLWNPERTKIITRNHILVKNVFKGSIKEHRITIYTLGGQTDDLLHFCTHTINLAPNQKGYFFLKNREIGDYSFLDDQYGFAITNNDLNPKVFAFGEKYSKPFFEEKLIQTIRLPKISINEGEPINNDIFFQNGSPCRSISQSSEEKTIEFQFENVQYTDNFTHLEFDVTAKVNLAGLKFGKGNLFIQYSEEFGTNAVTNETIEVTKGAILEDNLYTLNYEDYNSQVIKLTINSNTSATDFYTFSASSEPLCHVKVAISNFTQIGNISFDDIDISGEVYYWCDGRYALFEGVELNDQFAISNPKNIIGITYSFENVSTNSDQTEFTVDLFAEATEDSYYTDGFIIVNYNELGFGESVVSDESFSFILEPFMPTDIYTPFISDIDNNTLQILIFGGDDPAQNTLSLLSTTPKKLGKLKFTVNDCDENIGLSFDETGMQSAGTVHHNGMMPIPWELYSPIIADDEENDQICGCSTPIITSFETPHPNNVIHAGTGDILIITGENFGNWNASTNTVIFRNADNDGPDEIEAGIKDFEWGGIIHWSDNEIQILLPSTDKNVGAKGTASTGRFKVRNGCGISEESEERLIIPYSIFNHRGSSFGTALKMTIRETDNNGMCFNFSNELPQWIKTQFNIALSDWCNEVGANFFVGETINANGLAIDDINLISFSNQTGSSLGGMMHINGSYYNSLCNTGNEDGFMFKEVDFTIVSEIENPTFEDELQIRETIKHELGHLHMLAHARSPEPGSQYLMHPNANINGVITQSDSDGGNTIFTNSGNIVTGNCGNPITSGMCGFECDPNSINEIRLKNSVEIFPNPTYESVTIQWEENITNATITLSDIYGRQLQRWNLTSSKSKQEISLPKEKGVYFISIEFQGKILSEKIVKL